MSADLPYIETYSGGSIQYNDVWATYNTHITHLYNKKWSPGKPTTKMMDGFLLVAALVLSHTSVFDLLPSVSSFPNKMSFTAPAFLPFIYPSSALLQQLIFTHSSYQHISLSTIFPCHPQLRLSFFLFL